MSANDMLKEDMARLRRNEFFAEALGWIAVLIGFAVFVWILRNNAQDWQDQLDAWYYGEPETEIVQQACPKIEQEACEYRVSPM